MKSILDGDRPRVLSLLLPWLFEPKRRMGRPTNLLLLVLVGSIVERELERARLELRQRDLDARAVGVVVVGTVERKGLALRRVSQIVERLQPVLEGVVV